MRFVYVVAFGIIYGCYTPSARLLPLAPSAAPPMSLPYTPDVKLQYAKVRRKPGLMRKQQTSKAVMLLKANSSAVDALEAPSDGYTVRSVTISPDAMAMVPPAAVETAGSAVRTAISHSETIDTAQGTSGDVERASALATSAEPLPLAPPDTAATGPAYILRADAASMTDALGAFAAATTEADSRNGVEAPAMSISTINRSIKGRRPHIGRHAAVDPTSPTPFDGALATFAEAEQRSVASTTPSAAGSTTIGSSSATTSAPSASSSSLWIYLAVLVGVVGLLFAIVAMSYYFVFIYGKPKPRLQKQRSLKRQSTRIRRTKSDIESSEADDLGKHPSYRKMRDSPSDESTSKSSYRERRRQTATGTEPGDLNAASPYQDRRRQSQAASSNAGPEAVSSGGNYRARGVSADEPVQSEEVSGSFRVRRGKSTEPATPAEEPTASEEAATSRRARRGGEPQVEEPTQSEEAGTSRRAQRAEAAAAASQVEGKHVVDNDAF